MKISCCVYTNTECDRGCPFCLFDSVPGDSQKVSASCLSALISELSGYEFHTVSISSIGESLLHPELGEIAQIVGDTKPERMLYVTSGPQNDVELQRYWDVQAVLAQFPPPDRSPFTGTSTSGQKRWSETCISTDWRKESLQRLRNALEVSCSLHIRFRQGLKPEENCSLARRILSRAGFSTGRQFSRAEEWCYSRLRNVRLTLETEYLYEGRAVEWLRQGVIRRDECLAINLPDDHYDIGISPYGLSPCSLARSYKYPLTPLGMRMMANNLGKEYEAIRQFARKNDGLAFCHNCPVCR